jgi:hypothetical protein
MHEYRTAVRKAMPDSVVRTLKRHLPHRMRHALSPRRHWSIGIYAGNSPLELRPTEGIANPVLTAADVTDVDAAFVADPFALRHEGRWYVLFEVFDQSLRRGSIGAAVSDDLRSWTYLGIVLREPFHLSYPHLLQLNGEIYLMPESAEDGGVRLYRATSFPTSWELVGHVLGGPSHLDSTVFHHGDRWWMLTETGCLQGTGTLRLFSSESLMGAWREHPASPVVASDPRTARPAGRVVNLDGRPVRFAQDCYPFYGSRTLAFEILTLSETEYRERPVPTPVLVGTGSGWNGSAMHHVDAHQLDDGSWIGFVDGS